MRSSLPISSPTECTTFRAANGTIDTAFNMLEKKTRELRPLPRFERKEFTYAAVATHSSRRTFRCHRTQDRPRTGSWPGGCSHLDGSGPDESVGLFVRPWHIRHPASLPILGRRGGCWPSRQDRVEG